MRHCSWLLIACALVLALPRAVSAHADLVRSTPEAGATLSSAPAEVSAAFTQKIGPDGSTLAVVDAGGADVTAGPSQLDPADSAGRTMKVALKSGLVDGTYTVTWKVISTADGDTTEGSFTFTVSGGSAAQPATAASPAAEPVASAAAAPAQSTLPATGQAGSTGWLVLGAIWLAVGLVALGAMLRRRAFRSAEPPLRWRR